MIVIQDPRLSGFSPCTYIPGEMWRFEYFFALDLSGKDLDELLGKGWRKFGEYFFRPNCASCLRCIPLRVSVDRFQPTRSQKRVAKKCSDITVRFGQLAYRDEIFEIYQDHSLNRFGKESAKDEFIATFYIESCPSIQSEYYLGDDLVAVGFLDVGERSLSTVYFVYLAAYEEYSLGTYSILTEIEHAASLEKSYYYLGYYIQENKSMRYKNHFHPNEKYDWISQCWEKE